jgi:hypothetical protein
MILPAMSNMGFQIKDLLSPFGVASLVVVGYILHCFTQNARLSHFKGPSTTGFSKLWLLKVMRSGNMHIEFQKVNQKYGMIN